MAHGVLRPSPVLQNKSVVMARCLSTFFMTIDTEPDSWEMIGTKRKSPAADDTKPEVENDTSFLDRFGPVFERATPTPISVSNETVNSRSKFFIHDYPFWTAVSVLFLLVVHTTVFGGPHNVDLRHFIVRAEHDTIADRCEPALVFPSYLHRVALWWGPGAVAVAHALAAWSWVCGALWLSVALVSGGGKRSAVAVDAEMHRFVHRHARHLLVISLGFAAAIGLRKGAQLTGVDVFTSALRVTTMHRPAYTNRLLKFFTEKPIVSADDDVFGCHATDWKVVVNMPAVYDHATGGIFLVAAFAFALLTAAVVYVLVRYTERRAATVLATQVLDVSTRAKNAFHHDEESGHFFALFDLTGDTRPFTKDTDLPTNQILKTVYSADGKGAAYAFVSFPSGARVLLYRGPHAALTGLPVDEFHDISAAYAARIKHVDIGGRPSSAACFLCFDTHDVAVPALATATADEAKTK